MIRRSTTPYTSRWANMDPSRIHAGYALSYNKAILRTVGSTRLYGRGYSSSEVSGTLEAKNPRLERFAVISQLAKSFDGSYPHHIIAETSELSGGISYLGRYRGYAHGCGTLLERWRNHRASREEHDGREYDQHGDWCRTNTASSPHLSLLGVSIPGRPSAGNPRIANSQSSPVIARKRPGGLSESQIRKKVTGSIHTHTIVT